MPPTQPTDGLSKLVESVCNALSRSSTSSRKNSVNPVSTYRDRLLEIRAAISCRFLKSVNDVQKHEVAYALHPYTIDEPICSVARSEISANIAKCRLEIENLKADALAHQRAVVGRKPLEKSLSAYRWLTANGDLDFVSKKLLTEADETYIYISYLKSLDRDARGFGYEAAWFGQDLLQNYTDEAIRLKSDSSLPFRLPGTPNSMIDIDDHDGAQPHIFAFHVQELIERQQLVEAINFAADNCLAVENDVSLAFLILTPLMAALPPSSQYRAKINQAATHLPPKFRPRFAAINGSWSADLLASSIKECAQASVPIVDLRWVLNEVWKDVIRTAPDYPMPIADQSALLAFGSELFSKNSSTFTDRLPVPYDPDLIPTVWHHRLSAKKNFRETIKSRPDKITEFVGPRAAEFFSATRENAAGVLLYGNHVRGLDEISYLGMYAASICTDRPVIGLLSAKNSFEQDLRESWMKQVCGDSDELDRPDLRLLNIFGMDDNVQTRQLINHLKNGGILDVVNDGLEAPGVRALVPWVLRPYALRIFPAQIALATNAKIGFRTIYIRNDGTPALGILPVTVPPDQGGLKVRAIWLTQNLARMSRNCFSLSPDLFNATQLAKFGGLATTRDLISIDQWASNPDVSRSLVGWIGDEILPLRGTHAPEAEGCVGRADVKGPALRIATMLLHFQNNAVRHINKDRRFLDQHRVAFIGPKGAAMLAMATGSLAVGSLFCAIENDVPQQTILQRLQIFRPSLIISTASKWGEVLQADRSALSWPVMILADEADDQALNELLDGFAPANALPAFEPDQPGMLVFTSGTDGNPKGAVIPAGVLSNAAGLDRCAKLNPGDRVCYLTRWDTVSLADLMACLRGSALIAIPTKETLQAHHELTVWLQKMRVDFLSAPVTMWTLLLRTKSWQTDKHLSLNKGLLWGEPITKTVISALERQLPKLEAFCIYGSTEVTYTAFGSIREACKPVMKGSPGGTPIDGTLVEPKGSQTIIRSSNCMLGYFADLRESNALPVPGVDRTVVVNDVINISKDGFLDVLGRSDSVFKYAGRRFSLRQFEKAAETIDDVGRAIGFTVQTSTPTELVLALQATSENPEALRREVRSAIFESSGGNLRAKHIYIFDNFPILTTGKLDRIRLRNWCLKETETPAVETPTIQYSMSVEKYGGTLSALLIWAQECGFVLDVDFDPNHSIPEMDSLDKLELGIMLDEFSSQSVGLEAFDLDSNLSWRSLAGRIDETLKI